MTIRIIKIITLSFAGVLLLNTSLANAQETDNKLYKWQDSSGKWYYSKIPPESLNKTPQTIEVANDSRTIIFQKQKNTVSFEERAMAELQLKQKKANCQGIQSDIKNIALNLHKTTDQKFQQETISLESYAQDKKLITKLEDISSDINFTDSCIDDFSNKPQVKAISNCVIENTTQEDRTNCLKELSAI